MWQSVLLLIRTAFNCQIFLLIRPCLIIPWLLHARETNSYIMALWLHVQSVATYKGLEKADTTPRGQLWNIFYLSIVFGKPWVHEIKM